jgi:hypothetical protein
VQVMAACSRPYLAAGEQQSMMWLLPASLPCLLANQVNGIDCYFLVPQKPLNDGAQGGHSTDTQLVHSAALPAIGRRLSGHFCCGNSLIALTMAWAAPPDPPMRSIAPASLAIKNVWRMVLPNARLLVHFFCQKHLVKMR